MAVMADFGSLVPDMPPGAQAPQVDPIVDLLRRYMAAQAAGSSAGNAPAPAPGLDYGDMAKAYGSGLGQGAIGTAMSAAPSGGVGKAAGLSIPPSDDLAQRAIEQGTGPFYKPNTNAGILSQLGGLLTTGVVGGRAAGMSMVPSAIRAAPRVAASDTAGLETALSGLQRTLSATPPSGALGMAGGKMAAGGRDVQPSAMDSLRQIAEDATQEGTKKILGLDKPPLPRTHQEYVASKTKRMSGEEILNSDALWAAARDLAAQKNIPMSKAYSQLGEQVLGRPLTAQEFASQMTAGARYGLLGPRKLYD